MFSYAQMSIRMRLKLWLRVALKERARMRYGGQAVFYAVGLVVVTDWWTRWEGLVFFFGSVSVVDRGFVARQVGVERESYGFGSRFHLVATRGASGVGLRRSVVEVVF